MPSVAAALLYAACMNSPRSDLSFTVRESKTAISTLTAEEITQNAIPEDYSFQQSDEGVSYFKVIRA